MSSLTLTIGGLLTATGIVAYFATGATSFTALIPSVVGVLLLVAGFIARNPTQHRNGIVAATIVAALGVFGSLMNVMQIGDLIAGTSERPTAVLTSTIMFVLLVVYLGAVIGWFVRKRQSAEG